jgi:hypothetical protein
MIVRGYLTVLIIISLFVFTGNSFAEEGKKVRNVTKGKSLTFNYDEKSKLYTMDTRYYAAEFRPLSFTYTLKGDTGTGKPITFALLGFYQGEEMVYSSGESPVGKVEGNILTFEGRDFNEHYQVVSSGILQGWTIKVAPPVKDKDLIMRAKISTEYSMTPRGNQGFAISDGGKEILNFRTPIAFDRKHRRYDLKAVLKGEILEIIFTKDFLADAEFPLIINPPVVRKKIETIKKAGEVSEEMKPSPMNKTTQ